LRAPPRGRRPPRPAGARRRRRAGQSVRRGEGTRGGPFGGGGPMMTETERPGSISREPTPLEGGWDPVFRPLTLGFAWLTILLVVFLVYQIGSAAAPAVQRYGLDFLTTQTWDAGKEKFGVLPQIWGTLYTSVLGLLLGSVMGLAVAIFLTQD